MNALTRRQARDGHKRTFRADDCVKGKPSPFITTYQPEKNMTPNGIKIFICTVYVFAGAFLLLNLLSILAGQVAALVPAALQLTVLISVYRRVSWAWIAVSVWAAFMVGAGAFKWAALLVRPGPFDEPLLGVMVSSALLMLGVYFLAYARKSLSPREPSGHLVR